MAGLEKQMMIDDRLQSYESLWDKEWAARFSAIVTNTLLDDAGLDLCASWSGAAHAHGLPSFAVTCSDSMRVGIMSEANESVKKAVSLTVQRITRSIQGDLRNMAKKKLLAAGKEAEAEIHGAFSVAQSIANATVDVPSQLWSDLIGNENSALRQAVLGLERLCYGALYFAYEDFLRHCVGLVSGTGYHDDASKFWKAVKGAFGKDGLRDYFNDPPVKIGRTVRNALVHNGGKVTSSVLELYCEHPNEMTIPVVDNELQVLPEFTKKLFGTLKNKATQLAEDTLDRSRATKGAP